MSEAHPAASRARLVAAFAAVYTIWGSTYLAIRFAIETLPPFLMAGARFLAAGLVLYVWNRLRGTARHERGHWIGATVLGATLLAGGNGSLVWAELRVPSGLAALLGAITPLWMVLFDGLEQRDLRLGGRVVAGLLMGFAGLALLVGPSELLGGKRADPLGAGVLLFGSLSWTFGSLYSRRAKLPQSHTLGAAMQMLAGGFLLLVMGTLAGETSKLELSSVSIRSIFALYYLIAFGSLVGYTAYTWLFTHTTTARASTYAYVNPVVAVFLGWALGGEALTARTLVATAIIVSAVALLITHGPPPAPPEGETPLTAAEQQETAASEGTRVGS